MFILSFLSSCLFACVCVCRIRALLEESDDFRRRCIDQFSPLHIHIANIMHEMKDAILFVNDAEGLRNQNVFNPLYEGSNMGLPTNRSVSVFFFSNDFSVFLRPVFCLLLLSGFCLLFEQFNVNNNASVYSQLISLDLFYEFVAFSALVCPQCLVDEQLLTLLREVASYRALLPIYRDLVSLYFCVTKRTFILKLL